MFTDPPLRSSKIAICGFGSETLGEAPFDDPDCEIWILNMLHSNVPRWDRLFELHDRATVEQESDTKEEQRKKERGGMAHLDYLRSITDRPIYLVEEWPDVPCGIRFPIEKVTDEVGAFCPKLQSTPYFQSTFAFMLVWAVIGIVGRRRDPRIPEEGEEIWVCGVEMINGEEYAYQRSNAEFLCGWVLGHHIKLNIPQRSALLESDGIYGYSHANETLELLARLRAWGADQRKSMLAKREDAATAREKARADWNTYDGASQAFEKVIAQVIYLIRGGKI